MAKILVVDDSAVIRDLLADFLGEMGHQIDTAVDGIEGLEKASTGDYDLCICDLHLPRKNGYQLFTELEAKKEDIKFIFTDSLPDELYERIQETTGHPCLRKPFDLDQVRETLSRILEKVETA